MKVRVANDICVKVISDPEHDGLWKGQFILLPNSMRRDLTYELTPDRFMKPHKKLITGKDMEGK